MLDDLLSRLEREAVTSATLNRQDEVTAELTPTKACTCVTPVTLPNSDVEGESVRVAAGLVDTARSLRMAMVAAKLASDSTLTRVVETYCDDVHEVVIVTLAIRGTGMCELSIPRESYDPLRLMAFVQAMAAADMQRVS